MLQSAQLQYTQLQSAQSVRYHNIIGNLMYQHVSLDTTEQALSPFTPEDGNMFSIRMSQHDNGCHFTKQIRLAVQLFSS